MSSDLEPKGESLRRAVRWISDQRLANPHADIKAIVNEAGLRYNLDPPDQEWLWHAFVVSHSEPDAP